MAIEYYVNEPKGTVVAVLNGTEYDALYSICKKIGSVDIIDFGVTESWSGFMPKCFKGIAKCDVRDKFDLEYGKRLAKSRCMKKYYDCKDKIVVKWFNNARNRMNSVENLIKENNTAKKFSYLKEDAKVSYDEALENYQEALKNYNEAVEKINNIF